MPYCYYGDELEMTNISFYSISQHQDIAAKYGYEKTLNEDGKIEKFMAKLKSLSIDNGLTPMQ